MHSCGIFRICVVAFACMVLSACGGGVVVSDAIEPVDTFVPSDIDDVGAEDPGPTDTARDEGQDADVGPDDPGPRDVKDDGVGDNGGKDLNVCEPDCGGSECGLDPVCGASCGTCDEGFACLVGQCVEGECVPDCGTAKCGTDAVCGTLNCGTCGDGYSCQSGECVKDACVPACGASECGLDPVCGTQNCGTCDVGQGCANGQCVNTGEMKLVASGSFWMGCNQCYEDESPYHEVMLSGYYIDKSEVTQGEYKKCVDADVCDSPGCNWNPVTTPNSPVVCVNWAQADEYCKWVGKRLPTEAEWEKAARGTDGRKYPWGNETPTCDYAVMYDGGDGCGTDSTWDVCSKSPAGDSPYGLCDMAGNVWEWVSDWYHSDYYSSSPSSNPTGASSGSTRVLRGGSFHSSAGGNLRASYRDYDDPSAYGGSLGFRCVRDAL